MHDKYEPTDVTAEELDRVYYKAMYHDGKHHDFQYKDGLNCLPESEPFAEKGDCVKGGLYFAPAEHLHQWIDSHRWVREIRLPHQNDPDFKMKRVGEYKFRANKIILGQKWDLTDPTILESAPFGKYLSLWHTVQAAMFHHYHTPSSPLITKNLRLVIEERCSGNSWNRNVNDQGIRLAYGIPPDGIMFRLWRLVSVLPLGPEFPHELLSLLIHPCLPNEEWQGMAASLIKDALYVKNTSVVNALIALAGPLHKYDRQGLAYWVIQYGTLDHLKMVHDMRLLHVAEDWDLESIPTNILSENETEKLEYLIEEYGMKPSGWVDKAITYLESKELDTLPVYRYLKTLKQKK